MKWLSADWPAPAHVVAFSTTRIGGVSTGCYAGLNLGDHVHDDPAHVAANRALVAARLPQQPVWLTQVHGVDVVDAASAVPASVADASVASLPNTVAAVMTADCLPVLFTNTSGTVVAAAHAGWRGLAAGVLEATVAQMQVPPETVLAWLGPALGPNHFEVGEDVVEAFAGDEAAFLPTGIPGKFVADIFALATRRLQKIGVSVFGGGVCTYSNPGHFYSHRRATHHGCGTGRMLSGIYFDLT